MAVSQMVSSPVHVDVVLDMDGTPNKNFAYTAYAQEKFSMTLMPSSMGKNPNFRSMCLDISEAEFHRCSLYLSKMVGRVEYNYTDAMFLLPAIGSGPISDVMVPDVDSSSPEMLEKVFCSQAALLVLKNCLSENEALMVALKGLNSRLTSPSILYRSIQGVFERMDDECP